jgi:hypothetical protein
MADNYGLGGYSHVEGGDPNVTAGAEFWSNLKSAFAGAVIDGLKQQGNAAIAKGFKKTSKSEGNDNTEIGNSNTVTSKEFKKIYKSEKINTKTTTSNAYMFDAVDENITEASKLYDNFGNSLDRLINNLNTGKQNLIEFNEIGNKLDVLVNHFNLLDSSTEKIIKNFRETGTVTKELTGLMGKLTEETKVASKESLELLSKSLEGTKEVTFEGLNGSLNKLISNLSSGKQNLIEFNETGTKLEVLVNHFGLMNTSTDEMIKKFKETGVVTKELTGLMEKLAQKTSSASEESLAALSKNLEKSKKGTKEYIGELVTRAGATVGTLTAIFYPLISAGLEQQNQINELSKMTDDLLKSSKNQEVFLKTTRDLSITYGEDLKEIRGLFADVASDLGLSYKQITKGSKESYETVNEELKTYLDQALILKKTTDLEEKTLRGLYKTVKLVGVNSKDAGGLVKVFTNSLAELRATNKFTKTDIEEVANSIQDIITNWGFGNNWGKKEIEAITTQSKNLMLVLTNAGGEGGKEMGKMILDGLSTVDKMVNLAPIISGMDAESIATAVKNQDLTPILKGFGLTIDKLNAEVDKIMAGGDTDLGKKLRIETLLGSNFGKDLTDKQLIGIQEHMQKIRDLGGSVKAMELADLAKPSPEAEKKMLEMQDNLAGIMARLTGLYNKFMGVFGVPIVNLITPIVSAFATLATAILDVVNLLPEFVKGILGIGVGTIAAVGLGTAITNLLGFTTGATSGFGAMALVLGKIGTAAAWIVGMLGAAAWPVGIALAVITALYALYKIFKKPVIGDTEINASELTSSKKTTPTGWSIYEDTSSPEMSWEGLGKEWKTIKDYFTKDTWVENMAKTAWGGGPSDLIKGFESFGEFFSNWISNSFIGDISATLKSTGGWSKTIGKWFLKSFVSDVIGDVNTALNSTEGWGKTIGKWFSDAWKTASDFSIDINPIKSIWTTVTDWICESITTLWNNLKKIMPDWAKKALGIAIDEATTSSPNTVQANIDHLAEQKRKEESNDFSTLTGNTWVDSLKNLVTNPSGFFDSNKNFTYKSGENLGNFQSYFGAFTQPSLLADTSPGIISPLTTLSTQAPDYKTGIAPTVSVISTMPEDVKELVKWLTIIANNTKEDNSKPSFNQYGYMPPTIDQRESMTRGQQPIVQGSQ